MSVSVRSAFVVLVLIAGLFYGQPAVSLHRRQRRLRLTRSTGCSSFCPIPR